MTRGWRRTLRPAVFAARYLKHRLKPRASYSDDNEDTVASILLGRIARFIDVGANDGLAGSNSALAALRGARGLCFEPNPSDYSRLAEFYGWTRRVECIAEGLSDSGGMVELRSDGPLSAITRTEDIGLTTLLADFNQRDAPLIPIRVERLSTWLDRRPDFIHSDLLSIDVEGHELSVLCGVDWHRHRKPARCLIIETHAYGEAREWRHRDFDAIDQLLTGQGYARLAASRNNTFWLHEDDRVDTRLVAARGRFPHYTWYV